MDNSEAALLLDLGLIVIMAWALGTLAQRLGQPAVIGEITAGILVGPTLFHGAIANTLFPRDVRPLLTPVADVGVALFMFVTGLEVDRNLLRGRGRTVVSVALGAMLLPLATGALVGWAIYRQHPTHSRLGFVLFVGAALSITAFPVLARILADRDLTRTRIGTLALACAAVDDVLAWLFLATILGIVNGPSAWYRTVLLVPYLALCVFVVRPLLRRYLSSDRSGRMRANTLGVLVAGLLLSGGLTSWMGLHFIFGAFLFGVIVPRETFSWLRGQIVDRVQQINGVFFVPVFFVVSGLNVDLARLTLTDFGELALILVVSVASKFAGTYLAARATGLVNRDSVTLAALMNTRGLTELIILNVGLQVGILDTRLYSMLVVMAVVTTAMTGPILNVVHPTDRVLAVPQLSTSGS